MAKAGAGHRSFDSLPIEQRLGAGKAAFSGRLMVDPAHRGRALASLLVLRGYEVTLAGGAEVVFCASEVALLRLYHRLGFRAYRPCLGPDGVNLRIPLVLAARDRRYLAGCGSPFLDRLAAGRDDEGRTAALLAGVYPHFQPAPPRTLEDLRTPWAELAHGLSRSERHRRSLLADLGEEDVDRVLAHAVTHRFCRGETVQLGRERRTGLAMVLDGKIGVGVPASGGYHWLELLEPGDVFGEAEAPPSTGHASDLVALEASEAAFLPEDIVERLERTHPRLAMRLARNLIAVLRRRVDDLHRLGIARELRSIPAPALAA